MHICEEPVDLKPKQLNKQKANPNPQQFQEEI